MNIFKDIPRLSRADYETAKSIIIDRAEGKCLDLGNSSNPDKLVLNDCKNEKSQQWARDSSLRVRNIENGKCLTNDKSAGLVMKECEKDSSSQMWYRSNRSMVADSKCLGTNDGKTPTVLSCSRYNDIKDKITFVSRPKLQESSYFDLDTINRVYKINFRNEGIFLDRNGSEFLDVNNIGFLSFYLKNLRKNFDESNKVAAQIVDGGIQDQEDLDGEKHFTQLYLTHQNDVHKTLDENMKRLEANKSNLKRQVEISMNTALKRNYIIYLLKLCFVFILLALVPMGLFCFNRLSKRAFKISLIVIACVWAATLFWTHLQNRDRHTLHFRKYNFKTNAVDLKKNKNTGMSSKDKQDLEKNLKCFRYQTVEDVEQKQDEKAVQQLIRAVKQRLARSIRADDFETAQELKNLLRKVEARVAAGDRFGGYKTREDLTKAVYSLYSNAQDRKEETRRDTRDTIAKLEANIENLKRQIEQKMQQVNEVNGPELRTEIADLLKRIQIAQQEIESLQSS